MRVKYNIPPGSAPNPPIFLYLDDLPDGWLHHSDYSLRHPYGTLDIALSDVMGRFAKVLSSMEDLVHRAHRQEPFQEEPLASDTKDFLHSCASFYDSCFHVLMALTPYPGKFKKITDWISLSKCKHAADFHSDTETLASYWKKQVNALKHRNGRVRLLVGTADGQSVVPGYFIDGVQGRAIGPDPEIHLPFESQATAYSYHFHLRQSLLYLYVILEKLLIHTRRQIKALHNAKLPRSRSNRKTRDLDEVVAAVQSLPLRFFRDETTRKYAKFSLGARGMSITFPHTDGILQYHGIRLQFLFKIEKHHPAHWLPYFGGSR